MMTTKQEKHLLRIKGQFINKVDKKYRAGQAEHGGDLFSLSSITLLDAAIDEAIDQVVYLLTLRDKLTEDSSTPPQSDPQR